MHILIIPTMYPHSYNPLSNIFFKEQAEALARFGHNVGVLAIVPITIQKIMQNRMFKFGLKIFNENGVNTFIFSFPTPPQAERLKQVIRKRIGLKIYKKYESDFGKPDIQHVHTFIGGGLAIEIEKKHGIPFVITEHSSLFYTGQQSKYHYRIAHNTFRKSKLNIAVSFDYSKFLSKLFSVDFKYVPNVVNTEYFLPGKDETNEFKILNIANLNTNKNHELLLKAFSIVAKKIPNVILEIGGGGPERKKLIKIVHQLGISAKVKFIGKLTREQVKQSMQNCDIFVLTSRFETFGVVIIEAMSCGKPVVSTKSGGPESIIVNSKYGELVDHSIKSIAEGLVKVIKNIKKYNSNIIRQYVLDTFSNQAVSKILTELYKKTCNY